MFKKLLASLGKGAATVDLQLPKTAYTVDESVQGTIVVRGGEVAQHINAIQVGFFMEVQQEQEKMVKQLDVIPVSGAFVIQAKEEKQFSFAQTLSSNMPLSSPAVSFYYDTHLDIEGGIDKKDVDHIQITPTNDMANVFHALETLGFRQNATSGKLDHRGQEFAFFPTTHFQHEVNEVECRFTYEEHGIRMWMEVDVKQGFYEKEVKRNVFLTEETIHPSFIENMIREAVLSPEVFPMESHPTMHPHESYGQGQSAPAGNGIMGVVGGFAAGIAGGMLINEAVDAFTEDEENDEDEDEDEE